MKFTFTIYLSLEHIHKELIDIPCEVIMDVYKGSNTSDDPNEIDIEKIKVLEPVTYIDNGGKHTLHEDDELKSDDKIKSQIIEYYENKLR